MIVVIIPEVEDGPIANMDGIVQLGTLAESIGISIAVDVNSDGEQIIAALRNAGLINIMSHEQCKERLPIQLAVGVGGVAK